MFYLDSLHTLPDLHIRKIKKNKSREKYDF